MVSRPKSLRRVLPAFGLALVASLALSAIAMAGSASAATQNWYSCKNVGAGKGAYEDPACTKAGGTKTYAWDKLATATSFKTKNTVPFTFKLNISLTTIEFKCSSVVGEGKLENTVSGGNTSSFPLSLTSCTVTKPIKNCSLAEPLTIGVVGQATEVGGVPAVKFSPTVGTILFGFEMLNAGAGSCPFNHNHFYIEGSLTGIMNNATSSLDFTSTSSALTYGGKPNATLVGTSKLETSAGEALKLAP